MEAVQLTKDMKPDVEEEADRIKKAKGRVFAHKSQPHILRVWLPDEDVPGLAMTRAFGDFDLKTYGIIATPELTRRRITSNDLFLVLACDGVCLISPSTFYFFYDHQSYWEVHYSHVRRF